MSGKPLKTQPTSWRTKLKPKPQNQIEIAKNSCYSYFMRVIFKTFFILSLLSVLYALSPRPTYALACSGTGYTCRLFDCAVGEVEDTSRECTLYDYICCKKVPTSTPQPTATPKPTNPPGGASPTDTPVPNPTIGGAVCPNSSYPNCSGTDYCNVTNCGKTIAGCPNPPIPTVPNCSSSCLNGHCYTTNPGTNPTITDVPCTTWGSWGSCLSGSSTCGGCASAGYTCQTRFCANPPNSNQYQISCGCNPTGGGGGGGGGGTNPTNTPTPTTAPTNTPTSGSEGW